MNKLKDILFDLRKNQKAILAFNIQNIYQLKAIEAVVSESNLPVIAQFSHSYIDFFDEQYDFNRIIKLSNENVFFHLDHCRDYQTILKCLNLGFDSVMFDGSAIPLSQNIHETNFYYHLTQEFGALLESELGVIKGVEDGFGSIGKNHFSMSELEIFFKEANFDLIALSIGNAHGFYESDQTIQIDLLKAAYENYPDFYHVLHGGTGLSDDIIKKTISYGTVKINISTALKKKSMDVMKLFCSQNTFYDEKKLLKLYLQELIPFFKNYINQYSS